MNYVRSLARSSLLLLTGWFFPAGGVDCRPVRFCRLPEGSSPETSLLTGPLAATGLVRSSSTSSRAHSVPPRSSHLAPIEADAMKREKKERKRKTKKERKKEETKKQ